VPSDARRGRAPCGADGRVFAGFVGVLIIMRPVRRISFDNARRACRRALSAGSYISSVLSRRTDRRRVVIYMNDHRSPAVPDSGAVLLELASMRQAGSARG